MSYMQSLTQTLKPDFPQTLKVDLILCVAVEILRPRRAPDKSGLKLCALACDSIKLGLTILAYVIEPNNN
jgi:hypothetical protein